MRTQHPFAAARLARRLVLCAVLAVGICAPASAQTQTFNPRDESPEEFPAGPGRDETFYACTACHNFKLVAQQGMDRRRWDDTLDFMTEKHNMPKLEGQDRETILNYLETTYGPDANAAPGGWRNPFSNQ